MIGPGMSEGGSRCPPPQILADQKAPHYYMPHQIFRLCNMPEVNYILFSISRQTFDEIIDKVYSYSKS